MKDQHNDKKVSHLEHVGWLVLFFLLSCWATIELFVFLSSEAEARELRGNGICRDIGNRVVPCPLGRIGRNIGPVKSPVTNELDVTLTLVSLKRG